MSIKQTVKTTHEVRDRDALMKQHKQCVWWVHGGWIVMLWNSLFRTQTQAGRRNSNKPLMDVHGGKTESAATGGKNSVLLKLNSSSLTECFTAGYP